MRVAVVFLRPKAAMSRIQGFEMALKAGKKYLSNISSYI